MKITIIGGGSYQWTPVLIQSFMTNSFFEDMEICLMDINQEALNDVYQLCCMYNQVNCRKLNFKKTIDLANALDGASYVIVAISHGGLEAELEDHKITRKFGYYNMKGSEVGIAGCSRTLRMVPEIVRIAHMMEKYCPDAMLLNVSNPLTAITRAVNKYTSVKSVGFCHGVVNHLQVLFPLFGAESWDGLDFKVAGVDHCSWLLEVKYHGRNVLEMIKETGLVEEAKKGSKILEYDDPFAGKENQRLRFLIWDTIGYLPAISDEHCIEFFGQIMGREELRKLYNVTYDRILERSKTVKEGKESVKAILKGESKPEIESQGEQIDKFIAALNGYGSYIDVLNYQNIGQIQNLPQGSVVETRCMIDANGVTPMNTGGLPSIVESIVRPIVIREELYMEAAIENDVNKLRCGLATDPLVNDFRNIDRICDELMEYNRKFLS